MIYDLKISKFFSMIFFTFRKRITPSDVRKIEKVLGALQQEASVAPFQYRVSRYTDVNYTIT